MPRWTHEQLAAYQARGKVPHTKQSECEKTLGKSGEGETQSTRRPTVRFTLFRRVLLDVDAKYTSVKDLLDGLRYAGLIHGDREDQIDLEVRQVKVKTREEERTEIEIL